MTSIRNKHHSSPMFCDQDSIDTKGRVYYSCQYEKKSSYQTENINRRYEDKRIIMKMDKQTMTIMIGVIFLLLFILIKINARIRTGEAESGTTFIAIALGLILIVILFFLILHGYKSLKNIESGAMGNMESVGKISAEILSSKMKSVRFFSSFSVKGIYNGREAWVKGYWSQGSYGSLAPTRLFWVMRASIVPRFIQKHNKFFVITRQQPTPHTTLIGKLVRYKRNVGDSFSGSVFDSSRSSFVDLDKNFTREEVIDIFDELTKAAEIVEHGDSYYIE